MAQHHTRMQLKKAIVLGALLHTRSVQAQPPIMVDWIQDGLPGSSGRNDVHLNPVNYSTYLDKAPPSPVPGCSSNRVGLGFAPSGEPTITCCENCLEVYGISQSFSGAILTPSGTLIYITMDVGSSPYTSSSVSGVYDYGSGWAEPVTISSGIPGVMSIVSNARHALLAYGNSVFIGGETWVQASDSYDCPNVIWRYSYPNVASGTQWISCVDEDQTQLVKSLDLWNDTLLAVAYPKVTKVETLSGTPMGSFELFDDTPKNNGFTCASGDTLFWTSQFGGSQVHVGKYLINSGPIWEVTLPFAGNPVGLGTDDFGRLWTAAGNNIIWIDANDGSYQSYAYGQSVHALDMIGSTVAITGSMDGLTSYVLHGNVIP